MSLALDREGDRAVSVGWDGTLRLWDLAAGRQLEGEGMLAVADIAVPQIVAFPIGGGDADFLIADPDMDGQALARLAAIPSPPIDGIAGDRIDEADRRRQGRLGLRRDSAIGSIGSRADERTRS